MGNYKFKTIGKYFTSSATGNEGTVAATLLLTLEATVDTDTLEAMLLGFKGEISTST